MEKEAVARIKIDKLLQESGWRFFDSEEGKLKEVPDSIPSSGLPSSGSYS